jgi:hypothetical protein
MPISSDDYGPDLTDCGGTVADSDLRLASHSLARCFCSSLRLSNSFTLGISAGRLGTGITCVPMADCFRVPNPVRRLYVGMEVSKYFDFRKVFWLLLRRADAELGQFRELTCNVQETVFLPTAALLGCRIPNKLDHRLLAGRLV